MSSRRRIPILFFAEWHILLLPVQAGVSLPCQGTRLQLQAGTKAHACMQTWSCLVGSSLAQGACANVRATCGLTGIRKYAASQNPAVPISVDHLRRNNPCDSKIYCPVLWISVEKNPIPGMCCHVEPCVLLGRKNTLWNYVYVESRIFWTDLL